MLNSIITDIVVPPPIVDFKALANKINPTPPRSFDLTQAVPNYPTSNKIREKLATEILDDSLSFYGEVPGLMSLRQKIAETHPIPNLSADQVLVTAGGNQAAYLSLTLLFSMSESVLLLEPYYFNHGMAIHMLGLVPQYFKLDAKDGFRLRSSKLLAYLQNHEVNGIILNTPNNPTGATYLTRDILDLIAYTKPKGIELIIDEAYGAFDEFHLREPELGRYLGNGLTLVGSFSKSYSLSGYRVGYFISSPEVVKEALKIQDTMIICPSQIGQRAALHGLNLCQGELIERTAHLTRLSHKLIVRCKELKNFRLVSCGPFFGYLKHPFNKVSCSEAALLTYEFAGILGLPGTVFGASQEEYLRLAYANLSESDLDCALDQLVRFDSACRERAKQWISSEA